MASTSGTAVSRLKKDYIKLKKDPVPYIVAEPCHANLLEWHYVVRGPEDTPFAGGFYHGKLKFPTDFPFRPPSIFMITPNGRFKTNFRLCLSMSDYHPDTWNPSWTVSTILTGLLSFMLESTATLGAIETTEEEKRALAFESHSFNVKDVMFGELFPELLQETREILGARERLNLHSSRSTSNNSRRTRFLMGSRIGRYLEFLRKRAS